MNAFSFGETCRPLGYTMWTGVDGTFGSTAMGVRVTPIRSSAGAVVR
jgi:hypothetical protein